MGCVFVEGDALTLFTPLKIPQGRLYPVYILAYEPYEVCHFVGL